MFSGTDELIAEIRHTYYLHLWPTQFVQFIVKIGRTVDHRCISLHWPRSTVESYYRTQKLRNQVASAIYLHVIHDQLIRQSIPDMSFLYFLIDHGVRDTHSAVDAESQRHLLIHTIKVRVRDFVDQLAHTYNPRLLSDREAENCPGKICSLSI